MFRLAFEHWAAQHPEIGVWAGRLRRIPRWGWIAVGIGVVVPIVMLLGGILLVAVASGLAVLAVVMAIVGLVRLWRRLTRRRNGSRDDGRRNVRLVVRSVNVRSNH